MRQIKLISFDSFVKSYKKGSDVVIAERNVEIHKLLKSVGIENPIYVQNRFQFARALRAANAAGIVPYVIANTSLIARGIQIQAAFTVVLTASATDKTLTIYDSVDEVKAAGKQLVAFVDSIVAYDLLGDQVDYVKKIGESQVPLFTFDSRLAFNYLISILKSDQDGEILYMQKQQPADSTGEDPSETIMKFQ